MIFIAKGDAPMSVAQAVNRGLAHYDAEKALYMRETGIVTGDPAYIAWAEQWLADNVINGQNNQFNHALAAYRRAVARMAQEPIVADEEQGLTEDDVAADAAERAAAQAVIDAADPEVAGFDG